MLRSFFVLVGVFALAVSVAFAHGDKKHVKGTLEKINADSLVVKMIDGKSVEVKLAPSTVYVSGVGADAKPAKLSDLAVGERVIIHAMPKGESLIADEVRFSPAGSQASAKTKP